jgi:hypothetical protein
MDLSRAESLGLLCVFLCKFDTDFRWVLRENSGSVGVGERCLEGEKDCWGGTGGWRDLGD